MSSQNTYVIQFIQCIIPVFLTYLKVYSIHVTMSIKSFIFHGHGLIHRSGSSSDNITSNTLKRCYCHGKYMLR